MHEGDGGVGGGVGEVEEAGLSGVICDLRFMMR